MTGMTYEENYSDQMPGILLYLSLTKSINDINEKIILELGNTGNEKFLEHLYFTKEQLLASQEKIENGEYKY